METVKNVQTENKIFFTVNSVVETNQAIQTTLCNSVCRQLFVCRL